MTVLDFKNKLKEDDQSVFNEYIHNDNQPIEFVQAVIELVKEGYYNEDNISFKVQRTLLEFHYDAIPENDIILLLNKGILNPNKLKLKRSMISKIDQELLNFLSDSIIRIAIDEEDSELIKKFLSSASRSLGDEDIKKVVHLLGIDYFVENIENLSYIEDEVVSILSEKELYKLINFSRLFEGRDMDSVSLDFVKKYIEIHYQKEDSTTEGIIEHIYKEDKNWVNKFLKNKTSVHKEDIIYLDHNFSNYKDIFKNNKSHILEYYDNNKDKLSEKDLFEMIEIENQLGRKIILSNIEYSEDLLELSFTKELNHYRLDILANNLIARDINFKNRIYHQSLDHLLNNEDFGGQSSIRNFKFDYTEINPREFYKYKDITFYKKMILEGENSLDDLKSLIQEFPDQVLIEIMLDLNKLKEPISFILSLKEDLDQYHSFILNHDLNQSELLLLIDKIGERYKSSVIYNFHKKLDKSVILKNIKYINSEIIIRLIEDETLDISDIEVFNVGSVNDALLKISIEDSSLNINEYLSERKVSSEEFSSFMEKLTEEGKFESNFKKIISFYSEEKYLKILISDVIYFLDEEDKIKYCEEILNINTDSSIAYTVIKEYSEISNFFKYKNRLGTREFVKLLKNHHCFVPEIYTGSIHYLSHLLKMKEDSKRIRIYLGESLYLTSYSPYTKKFEENKYGLTEMDYSTIKMILENTILELPKNIKLLIKNNLEYTILNSELKEVKINNLEEMEKWFNFYELDEIEVSAVRVNTSYSLDFGVGKDKKEQASEFVQDIVKLKLSKIDNIVQSFKNFNRKRGYGVECEFSIEAESQDENYEEWGHLNFKKLKAYIEKNYSHFEFDEEGYSNLESLQEDFSEWMWNNDMRDYSFAESFDELGDKIDKKLKELKDKRSVSIRQDYYSSDGQTWDLKTDSSVDDEERGFMGVELASPILYGKSDLKIFKEVVKALIRGEETDVYNAGVHVHHDVTDFKDKFNNDMSILQKELYPMQEMLFNLVDSDRISNSACQKYDFSDLRYGHTLNRREQSINFRPDETIEFRLKEGTMDVEDISNWIALTHEITDTICNNLIKKTEKRIEKKKGLFDKIMIAAQAVTKRNINSPSQVESLMEMYTAAKNFSQMT